MFDQLPLYYTHVVDWPWAKFEAYYQALESRTLTADTVDAWVIDWSRITDLIHETHTRLEVNTTLNTADTEREKKFLAFEEEILTPQRSWTQKLKEKLLASGLKPTLFDVPLRKMSAEAALYRDENLPLFNEETRLTTQYAKIIGAQTAEYKGEEVTLEQLKPYLVSRDRKEREDVWRLTMKRKLKDRKALNDQWVDLFKLRQKIAANAGKETYREYIWDSYNRFDYTPDDCLRFHDAIEQVVVPAVAKLSVRRRQRLGVDTVRPWDTEVGLYDRAPLKPFTDHIELESRAGTIFNQLDPELGAQFEAMRRAGVLDLDNRKNKAPGGYCTDLPLSKMPFIFMNAVGLHDDVQTLLHEAGHAFHSFASFKLPYSQHRAYGAEIAEVASMAMELLAAPYLTTDKGGYYAEEADAARARIEHLEGIIQFWPYMSVVDSFQHWAYTHPEDAVKPDCCDEMWGNLWQRFMGHQDWSELEEERVTGWHRKLHIFEIPFYYVEYGMAQLGAVQVWANALKNHKRALGQYREALALGDTAPLPVLFETAGAQWRFDAETLTEAINLLMDTVDQLDSQLAE